jgi:hypothetical protein
LLLPTLSLSFVSWREIRAVLKPTPYYSGIIIITIKIENLEREGSMKWLIYKKLHRKRKGFVVPLLDEAIETNNYRIYT